MLVSPFLYHPYFLALLSIYFEFKLVYVKAFVLFFLSSLCLIRITINQFMCIFVWNDISLQDVSPFCSLIISNCRTSLSFNSGIHFSSFVLPLSSIGRNMPFLFWGTNYWPLAQCVATSLSLFSSYLFDDLFLAPYILSLILLYMLQLPPFSFSNTAITSDVTTL